MSEARVIFKNYRIYPRTHAGFSVYISLTPKHPSETAVEASPAASSDQGGCDIGRDAPALPAGALRYGWAR